MSDLFCYREETTHVVSEWDSNAGLMFRQQAEPGGGGQTKHGRRTVFESRPNPTLSANKTPTNFGVLLLLTTFSQNRTMPTLGRTMDTSVCVHRFGWHAHHGSPTAFSNAGDATLLEEMNRACAVVLRCVPKGILCEQYIQRGEPGLSYNFQLRLVAVSGNGLTPEQVTSLRKIIAELTQERTKKAFAWARRFRICLETLLRWRGFSLCNPRRQLEVVWRQPKDGVEAVCFGRGASGNGILYLEEPPGGTPMREFAKRVRLRGVLDHEKAQTIFSTYRPFSAEA